MRNKKRSLVSSLIAFLICFSLLLGTTYAWFTSSVTSQGNVIQSGDLNVEMRWANSLDATEWQEVNGAIFTDAEKWEPGYTSVRYIKVTNAGNLALKWELSVEAEGAIGLLAEVIDVYYVNPVSEAVTKASLASDESVGVLADVAAGVIADEDVLCGELLSKEADPTKYETVLAIAFHMQESAGNEYQNQSIGDGFSLKLVATQLSYESDAFGTDYDQDATWEDNLPAGGISVTAPVTIDAENKTTAEVVLEKDGVTYARVPAGTKLKAGATNVTLNLTDVENGSGNIVVGENEQRRTRDIHIEEVAEDNTTPIDVYLTEELPVGLNMGNYTLYHVEDGATVAMTLIADGAEPVHNNFGYDPATGDVTLYMASFSEVEFVITIGKAWEGEFDYSWYDANAKVLTIANADQLAGLSAIVGGMNGQTQNSFKGQTIKLVANINLGYAGGEEYHIFYPIGYYNSEGTYTKGSGAAISSYFNAFEGTFDGDGHMISNIYQNTWDMKGDNNYYDAGLQYYRDGMGLFGKVYGGTVKNLTVNNFSSDGEYTTTGVIAAYADCGATFENIAITHCNPRVYNIGNGGIVGCVGWYAKDADTTVTFKNITVDNTNKISALWGSWDVACGGIVGQYYPTSGQSSANYPENAGMSFENCHVSAQIDVYNDVCANYQYYAYRYAGMLVGSVRENETIDGREYPKMDGIDFTDCTVHFGTWNDYYYCELVANTLASYTHDHQMSRLVQVSAVDVNNMMVTSLKGETTAIPASGRYNYVVVTGDHATENATCYHFVDGTVWNHEDAGTEIVGNETVLKEDKQHLYLEFNNLVTGYGWGVTSMGIENRNGVDNLDVTIGLEESVQKFTIGDYETLIPGSGPYKLGGFFKELDGADVIDATVTVGVSYPKENETIKVTLGDPCENWEDRTVTIEGEGTFWLTIQDYYFCKSYTIEVTVIDSDVSIETPEGDFD